MFQVTSDGRCRIFEATTGGLEVRRYVHRYTAVPPRELARAAAAVSPRQYVPTGRYLRGTQVVANQRDGPSPPRAPQRVSSCRAGQSVMNEPFTPNTFPSVSESPRTKRDRPQKGRTWVLANKRTDLCFSGGYSPSSPPPNPPYFFFFGGFCFVPISWLSLVLPRMRLAVPRSHR